MGFATRRWEWVALVARVIMALTCLLVLGVTAYLVLAWGSAVRIGGVRMSNDVLGLGVLACMAVPIAALPMISDYLRSRPIRWLVAPSALLALAACVGLVYDALMRGFIDGHVPLIVLPTLPCALYVSWCVLSPRHARPGPRAE